MDIFKMFKKKSSENIVKTNDLNIKDLFLTPLDQRNYSWIIEFNKAIKGHTFTKGNPENIEDEVGMHYLNLSLNSQDSSNSLEFYMNTCLENGDGIAICGTKEKSDWIFSYGDLLNYSINGVFYSVEISEPYTGRVIDTYINDREARIGQPSEKFLPQSARKNIRDFLFTFNLVNVKIALIWWIDSNRLTLAFNIVPEQFTDYEEENLQSLLQFLSWYLPRQYQIIFVRETEDFVKL
ncbi:hypothetical protein [Chryseobacterium chendengshani]|uniref:hypothetical protein n=1 Tax=Chryseobacterium sp. LJ756 TaxID=2864113 RepID=UPI001C63B896|nr:hypothetical protein [Chryseobacterium sp. LJ756]MBW7674044.1 hypothetical protein [Chryseobacterium sp. LJ756]